MTIDKAKLTELLVERTGLPKDKVEEQLLQLVSRIQQAAEQGKSFHVEGFGTFSVTEDNALHFEPVDSLETEINHKYAGMKPIELIGAFKEMPPVEEEESDAPEEGQPEELEEQAADDVWGFEENIEIPDLPPDVPEPVEAEEEESAEEEPKASFVFDTDYTGGEEELVAAETEPEVGAATSKTASEAKAKDPIGTFITVCVIILSIGVAGWAVYDFGLLSKVMPDTSTNVRKEQNEQTADVDVKEQGEVTTASTTGNTILATGKSQTEETNVSEQEQQAENEVPDKEREGNTPAVSTVYGLKGAVHPGGNDGYTVVVHSLGSRGRAEARVEELTSEGYRVVIASAIIEGRTYWRVGLGQFETVADAQRAARSLPEPFKSNHFIKRIQ